jgi:membrane-associated phospholipid phosphatase
MAAARLLAALWMLALLGGCAGRPSDPSWGPRWPGAADLAGAAADAARSPATWLPLAGAAVLSVGDLDDDLSRWAADETPLFGDDAEAISDHLRDAAGLLWLASALAAPSDGFAGKLGGVAVGAATLVLEDEVTDGIKAAADRRRPDASDRESFSSGHAGTATAATTLARRNLDYLALSQWLDTSLRVGLHGIAVGTGWARVEAEKHHVTDVLAGYAVGHFLAAFMHQAFMRAAVPAMSVRFQPLPDGGAITVVLAAPR